MNKKSFNTPAITMVTVALAVLILATSNLSQTQRRPQLKGGVSHSEQQGDVFNSNSDPYRKPRPCKTDDCPCHSAQAVAFEEWDCAQQLADWDNHITKRMADIREINAYPEMRNKKKLDVAKDPDILLYLRRKEETQQSCDCLKKYYQQICSLSRWEEFVRLHKECDETDAPPYKPYPPEQGERPTSPRRDPLGFPSADAGTLPAPRIVYKPKCDRSLLFVNNPELLESADFADNGIDPKTVFEAKVTKPTRIFFEHDNTQGYPISYNIQLFNRDSEADVEVIIDGWGFVTGEQGGDPFRQLFEREKFPPRRVKVRPGEFIWLIPPESTQIKAGVFFSGVVDFEVRGGPASIRALGYRNINKIDGKAKYEGYITKYRRGSDQSRVYKGTIECAEVVAEGVDFTIDDSDEPGPLDVQFMSRGRGLTINSQWHTHGFRIGEAIKSDILEIRTPPDKDNPEGILFLTEPPWMKPPKENRPANLGNWGVVYTLKGNVTNNGRLDRCISITLELERAAIAWRGRDERWRAEKVEGRRSIEYYAFPVRAGSKVPFEAKFVLGGPSGTNLVHSVSVLGDARSCKGSQQ